MTEEEIQKVLENNVGRMTREEREEIINSTDLMQTLKRARVELGRQHASMSKEEIKQLVDGWEERFQQRANELGRPIETVDPKTKEKRMIYPENNSR